jgi:uncharacterized protein YllA (UPF0747 family)
MHIPVESLPSTSKFFLDYVRNWPSVSGFFSCDPSLDSVVQFAREREPIGAPQLSRLCSALSNQQQKWGGGTDSVRRLESGAVAVVAGQQPGLFTGPMYSILKALTAVKVARELDARGVRAVPVFWIASEDHDYEEIAWAGILNQESSFDRVRADLSDGDRTPVGWLRFGDDISSVIEKCFSILPPSEFQSEVRALIEGAYRPAVSPVDAFARMMTRLFAGTGLILVDPLDSELKALAEPVLAAAVRSSDAIRTAVLERSHAISEAGYHPQVRVDEGFTGLFAYRGRSRQLIRPDELNGASDSDLSPNVLLRPVVQDFLFPTVAYVGGPAEIAYFAQAAPIYDCLGIVAPAAFPRVSATLIEPPVSRVMKKYGFGMADVFEGPDELRRRAVGTIHDVGVFDTVRDGVAAELERLRPSLAAVDRTLGGALDNSRQKMLHQIERLQTRFISAESRRNEVLDRQLNTLTSRLYPERKLQERAVNVTSFLVRYGLNLVRMLDDRLELDASVHQVIEL